MADDDKTNNERPRPKFGELAPEGWVWHPPKDSDRLDTSHPVPDSHSPGNTPSRPSNQDALAAARGERPVPMWNRPMTIVLLFLGFLGMLLSIGTIAAIPQSLQVIYSNQGLGTYRPAPSVGAIMFAGQAAVVVIWLASAVWSMFRLARKRLAFFIPILAGVLAFLALIVCVSAILSSDPTLLDFYNKLST